MVSPSRARQLQPTSRISYELALFVLAFGISLASFGQSDSRADIDTLARDSHRLMECLSSQDAVCVVELSHADEYRRLGHSAASYVGSVSLTEQAFRRRARRMRLERFEASEPWDIVSAEDRLFSVVPIVNSYYNGNWIETDSYYIGISDDNGSSWKFIHYALVDFAGIDRIIPGYRGRDLPDVTTTIYSEPRRNRTRYLRTRLKGFAIIGGTWDGYYELGFDVRRRISTEIALSISFADPENPLRPLFISERLVPGQDELWVKSPRVGGLQKGMTYETTVIGFDISNGEEIFRHDEAVLFFPSPALMLPEEI